MLWRKEIDFDFGEGQKARASRRSAKGPASRSRLRPVPPEPTDPGQRRRGIPARGHLRQIEQLSLPALFGELHLEGFQVSHTKDGFRWEEHEEIFLEFLERAFERRAMPLLTQAEEYRVRPSRESLHRWRRAAADRTAGVIERDVPRVMEKEIDAGPDPIRRR